jgi:hypothetical protein
LPTWNGGDGAECKQVVLKMVQRLKATNLYRRQLWFFHNRSTIRGRFAGWHDYLHANLELGTREDGMFSAEGKFWQES